MQNLYRGGKAMQNFFGEEYYQNYWTENGGTSYENLEEFQVFIRSAAEYIKKEYHPQTVLDAGCAMGLLVAALRDLGVEAYGVDLSEYAISRVREDIRPYCAVGSLADPLPNSLPRRYDLVVSIEVLEHMPEEDGKKSIANLCTMSDQILFSSVPDDTTDPTHINLHETPYWCGLFAKQGFFSAEEKKPLFLPRHARFFQRKSVPAAVELYEEKLQNYEEQVLQLSLDLDEIQEKNEVLTEDLKISSENQKEYQALYLDKLKEYDALFQAYQATVTSSAWKMTKPLRASLDWIKKILKSNRVTYLICKGIKSVLRDGPVCTWGRVKRKIQDARKLKGRNLINEKELAMQRQQGFPRQIKFSILVPLYNTPEDFLKEMIESVQAQTYSDWELCLADGSDAAHPQVERIVMQFQQRDNRIKYRKLEKNFGISGNTNACIEMATGDYIALFDHDDLLHPSVLYENMKAICEQGADFIYTDEVIFQGKTTNIIGTHYKPDFAIDNLRANNYICHFTVFEKSLLDKTGLFRSECDGSQDFDMVLRLTEQAQKIVHIPKPLYFWRSHPLSVASSLSAKPYVFESAKKAVRDHLNRVGLEGEVLDSAALSIYRVKYKIKGNPLVSILIPNKDHVSDLRKCIVSIQEKSSYPNYEIIVIENNSVEEKTFQYYQILERRPNIRVVQWNGKFNYSAINNFGYTFAKGDYILLLNNDTEVISSDWIQEMLMYAQRSDVGAVGAKLYYPDGTIQHGGVVLGVGGVAAHLHCNRPKNDIGYMGRLVYAQDLTAVTAACMMIPRKVWEQTKGLDESFEVAFNDVDFCMRIRQLGYLIVFTPFAELYHYEYKSRKTDDTPEKRDRYIGEVERFRERWAKELEAGDPYYNPNFSLDDANFTIR